MTEAAKQLEGQLLRLNSADRAEIAEKILLSLDEPAEDNADQIWLEEAGRRLAALRAGQVQGAAVLVP